METPAPPPNPQLGPPHDPNQLTTATAASAQKAWHVLALLLSLRHPARPDELASMCTLFNSSPDFIRFLCSIPNSPLRLDHEYITLSQAGFSAVAQFFANSDLISSVTFMDSPRFVPRLLENFRSKCIVKTYCRKRKRISLEANDVLPNKHARDCYLDGNMSKSTETASCVSSFFTFDVQKLEKVISMPSLLTNPSLHQLDYETMNAEYGYNETGNLCRTGWRSDSLFHDRFPELIGPILDEKIRNPVPHPGLSLPPCIMDSAEVSKEAKVDTVNHFSNLHCGNSSSEEVGQNMTLSQAKNEAISQTRESCNEDVDRKSEEDFLHDSDSFGGHIDNMPIDSNYIDKHHIDNPGKILAEANNVVRLMDKKRTKVNQQCQGDMLKNLINPSTIKDDQEDYRNQAICQTVENSKCSFPPEPQQSKRDKKPKSVEQKTNRNYDQNMNMRGNGEASSVAPSISINNDIEQKPFPDFESFIIEEEEGSGGYGTVYRARRKSDGVIFAIKCPHVNANRNHVHNELKMLQRFGGRNFVIKYEGSFRSGNSECLVLEHVKHDRPEVLKRQINIDQLRWYAFCLFKALAGLHKQDIVHRDVKPGNFLFSSTYNKGYLIDFNLALDLQKKHGEFDYSNAGTHIPLPKTKSLPPAKDRRLTNSKSPEAVNHNAGKGSKSFLPHGNLKKKVNQPKVFTDISIGNIMKSQGADGSGITSAKDATSTRIPTAQRSKQPILSKGREELINLWQDALKGEKHESTNDPKSKRKRVAAPPQNTYSKFFYPTPMPLHASGIAIGGAGSLKSKGNGKNKREGPCVGTKGFRAPEVLFRSLHQGPKIDIWSAGVTILYFMIGRAPFTGDPDQNIKEIAKLRGSEDLWEVAKLHNHESLFPMELLDVKHLSPVKLRDWCARNAKRPDFLEDMPKSLFDLVDKCLTVNPRLRISAEEALRHEFFAPCHEAFRKLKLRRQGLSILHGESQPREV